MKRISLLLALAMSLPAMAVAESWTNVPMVDTQCSAKVKADPDAHTRACAMACAKSGFGIVDSGGNYLKFDSNGNKAAKEQLENSTKKDHIRVDVNGSKDGDTIHVQSLKLL